MKALHKSSLLICLLIFVMIASVGTAVRWPEMVEWYRAMMAKQAIANSTALAGDPFQYQPPLPSYVADLHVRYNIRARLDPAQNVIKGVATIQFDNPKTKVIALYSYPYIWQPMKIISITHDGKTVPYQRKDPMVTVSNSFSRETRCSLVVQFETRVPQKPSRFGVSDQIWTLTNWYPMLGTLSNANHTWYVPPQPVGYGDPYIYQYADYDVTFTAPASFQWVTSWGVGDVRDVTGGLQERTFSAKKLLNFTLVGGPNYVVDSFTVEPNLTVYMGSSDRQNLNVIKEIAQSAFDTYRRLQGDLPYPYVSIAETGAGTVFAMEYANMAIFSKDMYAGNQVDHWLPHEIAHLWWYNSVTNIEPINGWVDEGLVEANVYDYRKNRYGKAAANDQLNEYKAEYEKLKQHYPNGKLSKHLTELNNDERYWTWYARGALLYYYLREQIGDDKFAQFLQRVQRNYQGKAIGPEHLDQALGETIQGVAHYFVPNVEKLNKEPFSPIQTDYFVDLSIKNNLFYPEVPLRLKGQTVYFPLRSVMEKLGYEFAYDAKKGTFQIKADKKVLTMQTNSKKVTLNGKVLTLGQPLIEIKGKAMAPLGVLTLLMPDEVTFNKEKKLVSIH